MQLEINGKTFNTKFGVKFVRELDKRFTMEREGAEFGAGLELTAGFLLENKITTLADYLYLGTLTESPRPSQNAIDEYLDSVEDIQSVFDEVIAELEESNASKLFIANLKAMMEAQE